MNSAQQNTKKRNTPSPTTTELLRAIFYFEVDQVSELLDRGVSVNATIDRGFTALMFTLFLWAKNPALATVIVGKLLDAEASVIHTRTDNGQTALHFGARYGDLRVLQLLAARAAKLDPRNDALETPLDLLCRRTGADPACVDVLCQGTVTETYLRKALDIACRRSNIHVVQRVLAHLDNLLGRRAYLAQGGFWACLANENHCGSLLALLQNRLHTPTLDSNEFQEMLRQGDAALAARFARYVEKDRWVQPSKSIRPLESRPKGTNFVAFLLAARVAGWDPSKATKSLLRYGPPDLLAAVLQMGAKLEANQRTPQIKRDVIARDKKLRQNDVGDTELHVAVRTGRLDAVENCFQRLLNPFVANYRGELPIQLAQGPALQQVLRGYMRRSEKITRTFNWQVVRWYGPYFESMVMAFLQVRYYYRKHHNVHLPRDVLHKILDPVAESLFLYYLE